MAALYQLWYLLEKKYIRCILSLQTPCCVVYQHCCSTVCSCGWSVCTLCHSWALLSMLGMLFLYLFFIWSLINSGHLHNNLNFAVNFPSVAVEGSNGSYTDANCIWLGVILIPKVPPITKPLKQGFGVWMCTPYKAVFQVHLCSILSHVPSQ